MADPNLVLPNGPQDPEPLMKQIEDNMPNTPGDVEKASNPESILNRRHGDLTKDAANHRFTRSPRPMGGIKVPGSDS